MQKSGVCRAIAKRSLSTNPTLVLTKTDAFADVVAVIGHNINEFTQDAPSFA